MVFLAALRRLPNVLKAAKFAGVARSMAYKEREGNPEFKQAWDDAIQDAIENIEGVALDLAKLRDPKHNSLRIFMLRSHKPDVYGEKSEVKLSGSATEPLHMHHTFDLKKLSDEDLDQLERIRSIAESTADAGPDQI